MSFRLTFNMGGGYLAREFARTCEEIALPW